MNDPVEGDGFGEATSSDDYYDATRSKYKEPRPPEVDLDVLCEIEIVERTLKRSQAPDWFVDYLLFKHPVVGRFVPYRYVSRKTDPDDPPRAFVESGYMPRVRSNELRRSQAGQIKRVERQFMRLLAREIANLPGRAARAPVVHWGSPERRETA